MKNFMSILLICICGVLAACSNDNIYEKEDSGFVVRSKELIPEEDLTLETPWKFKYNVIDYSNTGGNPASIVKPGDFYYYSSNNYLVGDTLLFTTKESLRSVASLKEQLRITANSLQEQIAFSKAELQKSENLKEKNIKLHAELKITTVKNQKLTKFKNDLKKLVVVGDSATP